MLLLVLLHSHACRGHPDLQHDAEPDPAGFLRHPAHATPIIAPGCVFWVLCVCMYIYIYMLCICAYIYIYICLMYNVLLRYITLYHIILYHSVPWQVCNMLFTNVVHQVLSMLSSKLNDTCHEDVQACCVLPTAYDRCVFTV